MNEIANHDAQLNRPVQEHYEADNLRECAESRFWMFEACEIEALFVRRRMFSPKRLREVMEFVCEKFADQKEADHDNDG